MYTIKFGLLLNFALLITGCATTTASLPILSPAVKNSSELPLRFLAATPPKADYQNTLSKKISLGFNEVNLETILTLFGQQLGLNFIIDKNIDLRQHNYTFNMKDVSGETVLKRLLENECLKYSPTQGNDLFIYNGEKALINTLTIYKDLNQKDCKPLPSGSEIIVK